MDPVCCLLGICCPPLSEAQRETFVKALTDYTKDPDKAEQCAAKHFAAFAKLTAKIAKMAKE